jgi:hypothetical protein
MCIRCDSQKITFLRFAHVHSVYSNVYNSNVAALCVSRCDSKRNLFQDLPIVYNSNVYMG